MISLENVKILLQTAGISRLKIDFDDEQKLVNAEYIFRGTRGIKQITYQEIIDSLTIGLPKIVNHLMEGPTEVVDGPTATLTQELT